MSTEAGVLVGLNEEPLFWHLPNKRSAGSLPDSYDLWDVIWTNRAQVLGFAHSHPGSGVPGPSHEDLTTFSAIEAALGKRWNWWIVSYDAYIRLFWVGPDKLGYGITHCIFETSWLKRLREESNYDPASFIDPEKPVITFS